MKKKRKIKRKIKRNIIISIIAVLLIILIPLLIPKKNNENHEEYNSLKELLERFDCVFIKERNSDLENVETDIYLKFGKELHTDNERYFIDIVQTIAKFKNYANFRMIDEEKQIEIIAIANEQKNVIIKIYINGDSNYFGNNTSKEALQNQEEQNITNMQITSKEIRNLIANDWKRAQVDFGTRETIYEDYYYYFDEGIEVRTITAKAYNIIFRKNYKGEIVEGITTNMTQENVIKTLGNPTFGEAGDEVIRI